MIDTLKPIEALNVRGIIKQGYKRIKATCPVCRKPVVAIKPEDIYICPECKNPADPLPGERESMVSLPYFVLPREIEELGIYGDKPTSLSIYPAYSDLNRTLYISYAKFSQSKAVYCSSKDGKIAERYNKEKGKVTIPCSEECQYRKDRSCKLTATFYFVLPDIDMFSAFKIVPKSEISIRNIYTTLKNMADRQGRIVRLFDKPFHLKIVERTKKDSTIKYHVLKLDPPRLSRKDVEEMGCDLSGVTEYSERIVEYNPDVNSPHMIHNEYDLAAQHEEHGEHEETTDPKLANARQLVREKVGEYLRGQHVDKAIDMYVKGSFNKTGFNDLTIDELRELWHQFNDADKSKAAVTKVSKILSSLNKDLFSEVKH